MEKTYKARKGASFGNEKAEIYGQCLEELCIKHGSINPQLVVKEAKKKKSVLHDYFEWDNEKAGETYRLWQARKLSRDIIEIISTDNGEEIESQLFIHVTEPEQENPDKYVIQQVALIDPVYQEQILHRALSEINVWRKRYNDLKRLIPIFQAIDEVKVNFG